MDNNASNAKVKDVVGFKSDYEQVGEVIAVKRNHMGYKVLVIENKNGFGGEYLRYATTTEELASDCWMIKSV